MHRRVRTPCAMCSFPMYRYLLPTYCGECRGAFSGSPREPRSCTVSHYSALQETADFSCLIIHVHPPSAIPIAPKVAPSLIEEKLALLCRGLIILRNVLGPRARKRGTRGRRLQNFIVCHAQINNKTDLSSLMTCIISFSLKARRYLSCRAQVCVYVYVCMRIFIKFILNPCMCVYVYTRLYAIRVLLLPPLLLFLYIYSTLTRAFSRQPSISLPYIQYVKIYRLDVI